MPPDTFFEQHVLRVRSALNTSGQTQTISDYICRHTRLRGKPFNFDKFKFQKYILDHPARIKYIRKCSQVGVSEIAVREIIAFCLINMEVNALYCLPTASFASTFAASRLDPVIDASPDVAASVYPGTDSRSFKRFINNSFIFMRGMSTAGQAISVPASMLTFDEEDFVDDPEILSAFTSRLTASDFKIERHFSTPTVAGVGVSYGFDNSNRNIPLTKCDHCNHWFQADYYRHVRLPGYSESLHGINFFSKHLLTKYKVDSAFLECPKCGRPVDLLRPNSYEFVCENPEENFEATGFQVTPFIVASVVPPGEIIRMSTKYRSTRDFINNALGLPAEDSTTGLSKEETEALFISDINYPEHPAYQICGADLGGECACLTAYPAANNHLRIMNAELIPLHKMRVRIPELFAQRRVLASVFDALPYTDLVLSLQNQIPTMWASLFTKTKNLDLYQIREQEEDETKATYGVRQLNVKKHQGFDLVVTMIRAGLISFAPPTFDMRDTIVKHLTDMKRVNIKSKEGEEEFVWKKSAQGADHFFHALLYLVLANFMKGVAGGLGALPALAMKIPTKGNV